LKNKNIYIVLSGFLLINLFFTQIVANFLHDEHCDRDRIENHQSDEGSASAFQSDEDCLICSLDLFHEFFFEKISEYKSIHDHTALKSFEAVSEIQTASISLPGRSPPLL
jgi:hypothetical protein